MHKDNILYFLLCPEIFKQHIGTWKALKQFFIDSNITPTCSYTFRIHKIIKKKLPDSIKCKQSTSNGYCTVG